MTTIKKCRRERKKREGETTIKKKNLKRGDKINELGVVLNFIVFKIL